MVMRHPPNADDYKTQYVAQEFRSHHQEAVGQPAGNVLALHLGHVNFQDEESNNDSENPVAECLSPGVLPLLMRRLILLDRGLSSRYFAVYAAYSAQDR